MNAVGHFSHQWENKGQHHRIYSLCVHAEKQRHYRYFSRLHCDNQHRRGCRHHTDIQMQADVAHRARMRTRTHTPMPTLTIWARRYICAWLAVRAGLDALPSSTACWEIAEGAELTFWARLIRWAAAGEVVRLIWTGIESLLALLTRDQNSSDTSHRLRRFRIHPQWSI